MFKMCNTFQLGSSFTESNSIYSYANFNFVEQSDSGLYLYFGKPSPTNPFGESKFAILRFDIANLKWSARLAVYPTRMLETHSRVYVLQIKYNSTSTIYQVTVELIPDTTGKSIAFPPNVNLT